MIAAGSDNTSNEPKVFIFEYSEYNRKWTKTETINAITDPVHDLAFAPNSGRSYHVLAVASKDVSIFNLKPIVDQSGNNRFEVISAAQFNDHYCTVWRVTWNVTGTMLASSGDDGYLRMWRMNYQKGWKCICSFKPDANAQPTVDNPPVINPVLSTAKFFKKGSNNTHIQQH
jgi:WD40 repeat protein